jgi:IclR family KDG regulon transcriptional repressor
MVTLRNLSPSTGRSADAAVRAGRAVIEKSFTLLEAWSHRSEVLGVTEVARRSGLPKSTTYRLLNVMDTAGVVERVAGGYRIGDRLHGFTGLLTMSHRPDLREVVLPFLQDLYELTHETVHLGVLDGVDVRCVDKLYGHRRSPLRSRVGALLPVHSTALGKVLLAYTPAAAQRRVLTAVVDASASAPRHLTAELPAVLRLGVAFDRQETHPDVTCVAAPILSRTGDAIAAISISGPSHRFDPAAVVDRLRRAARAASLALAAGDPQVRAA